MQTRQLNLAFLSVPAVATALFAQIANRPVGTSSANAFTHPDLDP
jgi:hypothetical protein